MAQLLRFYARPSLTKGATMTTKKDDESKAHDAAKPAHAPHGHGAHPVHPAHAAAEKKVPAVPKTNATHDVNISPGVYTPSSVTCAVGDTVRWTNRTGESNTIVVATADGSGGETLTPMLPGATCEHVFDTAGSYEFHTATHPEIKGTVSVT